MFPAKGWVVENGWLRCVVGGRGGDIVSVDEFTDFELSWEWRLPPRANNGVKYFILEQRGQAIGHEYQMIDDATVKDGKGSTASFYDVLPPPGRTNRSGRRARSTNPGSWCRAITWSTG